MIELSKELVLVVVAVGVICAVSAAYFVQVKAARDNAKRQMALLKLETDADLPPLLKLTAWRDVATLFVALPGFTIIMGLGAAVPLFTGAGHVAVSTVLVFFEIVFGGLSLWSFSRFWSKAVNEEIDLRGKLAKLEKTTGNITGVSSRLGGSLLISMDYSHLYSSLNPEQANALVKHYTNCPQQAVVLFYETVTGAPDIDVRVIEHWYVRAYPASQSKSRKRRLKVPGKEQRA